MVEAVVMYSRLYYCNCPAIDFIMKLLVVDQLHRLTILSACEHSWMYEVAHIVSGFDCMFCLCSEPLASQSADLLSAAPRLVACLVK